MRRSHAGVRSPLVVAAGVRPTSSSTNRPFPFAVNPHFKHAAGHEGAGFVVLYRRAKTQNDLPAAARLLARRAGRAGRYWVEHFDIVIVRERKQRARASAAYSARCAIVGDTKVAAGDFAPNNPSAL
jgi:Xaa-Pro dipeptidase